MVRRARLGMNFAFSHELQRKSGFDFRNEEREASVARVSDPRASIFWKKADRQSSK
jgi:hypothetical protein